MQVGILKNITMPLCSEHTWKCHRFQFASILVERVLAKLLQILLQEWDQWACESSKCPLQVGKSRNVTVSLCSEHTYNCHYFQFELIWSKWIVNKNAANSPCRNEISELLNLLGRPDDPVPPLFVYGPAATGKTSIVREAMRVLKRPHAYVTCRSSHSPRLLFESILNQLQGHVRSMANNYSSVRRCEKVLDFTKQLPGACEQALSRKTKQSKRKHNSTKVCVVLPRSLLKKKNGSDLKWLCRDLDGDRILVHMRVLQLNLSRGLNSFKACTKPIS